MNKCEFCGNEHSGEYGSGRFCNKTCRAKYIASKVKNHKSNWPKNNTKLNTWQCKYCNKILRTRKELNLHIIEKHKRKDGAIWNKGLTKYTDNRVAEAANKNQIKILENYKKFGWKINPESIEKGRLKLINNFKNKPRQVNPRGKNGWYKGIWCDSSWELAYVLYCEDHNIKVERCTTPLLYTYQNIERSYLPDFVINLQLIEIKGYCSEKDKAKIEQHPEVKVLYYKDMQPILEYVILKYGKDFINKYEPNTTKIIKIKKIKARVFQK